jgi:hypothetical protein
MAVLSVHDKAMAGLHLLRGFESGSGYSHFLPVVFEGKYLTIDLVVFRKYLLLDHIKVVHMEGTLLHFYVL